LFRSEKIVRDSQLLDPRRKDHFDFSSDASLDHRLLVVYLPQTVAAELTRRHLSWRLLLAVPHSRLRSQNQLSRVPDPLPKAVQLDRQTHVSARPPYLEDQLPRRSLAAAQNERSVECEYAELPRGRLSVLRLQLLQVHVVSEKLQRAGQLTRAHADPHWGKALQMQVLHSHLYHHWQQKRPPAPTHQ